MKKLAEILTGPETWCQIKLHDGERRCLLGAMFVCGDFNLDRMLDVIRRETGRYYTAVIEWNDDPKRTWEEVAAVVAAYDRDRLLNP